MAMKSRAHIKVFLLLSCFFYFFFFGGVSTDLTDDDIHVFRDLHIQKLSETCGIDDEIDIVREVQKKAFQIAPINIGIEANKSREPIDLVANAHGLCYDRSRFIDKALKYSGFKTRHVYLLYSYGKPFIIAVMTKGQPSHAVTEVKTSGGWMVVDSNDRWISLTRSGQPVSVKDVWIRFSEFNDAPVSYSKHYWAIPGMYSRKGHLYGMPVPVPEFNWFDFISGFIGDLR